jgi:hypothetical protein
MAEKDAATRHWFTQCRAAMLSEVPKEIQDTLAEAERLPDGGEGVRAERRQLEERLSTLVKKAVQEMRSLGRSKDFKAVELALLKYGDFPKEPENDPWDVLQAHREDLVRAAKKRLRDVALVSDPVLLGRELETYRAYDKAAAGELGEVRDRYADLVKAARQQMQIMVTRVDTPIVDMQQTLSKFERYPDDVAGAREALKTRLADLIADATSQLAVVKSSDNVVELDAALTKYSGTGEALRQAVDDVGKRRQELAGAMRDELKAALSEDEPAKLAELVAKAEPFGADLTRWRSAVEDRRATVLQSARDAMSSAMRSGSYQACVAARDKFKGFDKETEAVHAEIVKRSDAILDACQDSLRALVSESDPSTIQKELEKYVDYGDDVKFEVEAVQERLAVIFREAKSDMELTATKEDATILEMDKVLQAYRDYPKDVDTARDVLQSRLQKDVREATDELTKLRQGNELKTIEAKLAEYQTTAGDRLRGPLQDLKDYRLGLYTQVRDRLRQAMELESVQEIDAALEEAKDYDPNELSSELRALERNRIRAEKQVLKEFQRLKRSRNFAEVAGMIARYQDSCPEELKKDYTELQQWHETLVSRAREALGASAGATHPSEIDKLLEQYESNGKKELEAELSSARDRRSQLITEANQKMLDVETDPGSTLKALADVMELYKDYPVADVRKARDKCKTKQAVMATKVRERLNTAAMSRNAKEVEEVLTEFADAGEIVDNAYKAVQRHFETMKETMRRKLGAALNQADTKRIQEVLDEAEAFGPSVTREVQFLKDRLDSLAASAKVDMEHLMKSSDYRVVDEGVAKYESYPEETAEAWKVLQNHKDKLEEDAKEKLRALLGEENPKAIDKVLPDFVKYGTALDDQREEVKDRRAALVKNATTEMQNMIDDGAATITQLTEMLERYMMWPSDIDTPMEALKKKKQDKIEDAEKKMKAALSGSDVEQVDLCLKEFEAYEKELGSLLKRLASHRGYLQDTIFDRVKAAMHFKKPADVQAVIDQAQPFLTDAPTADQTEKLKEHLKNIKDEADKELKAALETGEPGPLESALLEYDAFKEDAEVGAVLNEVRGKLTDLQQKARDDIREAIAEGDPVKMKALLQSAAKYKSAVQVELPALQRKLDTVVQMANKELQSLMRGTDIPTIMLALDRYKDHPPEFDAMKEALQSHMERAVENAKTRLLVLCASSDPREIMVEVSKYEAYGEELTSEMAAAKERLEEIIRVANEAMMAEGEKEDTSVEQMEAVLLRYSEFPADRVEDARNRLSDKIQTMTSKTRDQIRTLTVSQDIVEVDAGLKQFAKAGKHFTDLINDLTDHRQDLLNTARDKMKDALLWTKPKEIEELIEQTQIYGQEVNAENKALSRRRTALVREGIRTVQALTHSDNYAAVVKAIADYGEFAVETKSYVSQLEQHRDRLLLKVKDMLKEVVSETDPHAIQRVLDMVGGEYEELVAEEKEGATKQLEQVLEQARDKMNTMASNEESGLRELEDCFTEHKDFPPAVRKERDALRTKWVIRSTKAAEEVKAGCKLTSVTEVDEMLEKFKDSGSRVAEALSDLKKHRVNLTEQMGDALRDASAADDPLMMDKLLKDSEPYGKDLHAPRKAVERRKASVLKSINKEMMILQQSEDFRAISMCLARYQPLEEHEEIKAEISENLGTLTSHHADLLAKAKQVLSDLKDATDPKVVDEGMKSVEGYGKDVEEERATCFAHRQDLVLKAREDMEQMILASDTDTTLQQMSEKLAQYETFPDDVQKVRRKLQRKYQNAVRDTERKIRAAMASRNPSEVDEVIKSFEEQKQFAGEAYLELERHRRRLKDGLVEQMKSLTLSSDIGRIKAALDRAELFPAEEVQGAKDELSTHHTALIDEIKKELNDLCESTDFMDIEAGLTKRKGGGPDTQDEYDKLVSKKNDLVETCKTALVELKAATDPNVITDGLSEWEPYASATKETREDARQRWVELIDIAREEITTAIHSVDINVKTMDETLQKYEAYPSDVQTLLSKLKDKLTGFLETGAMECNAAAATTDFARIVAMIDKYDTSNEEDKTDHLMYELDALKAQQKSLQDIMSASLDDVKSVSDPRAIRRRLEEAEPYELVEEMKSNIEAANGRVAELTSEMKTKLEGTLDSEDIVPVTEALDEANMFADERELSDTLKKAQQHLKNLQQNVRQQLREAHAMQTPDEIDAVIESAGKYGASVRSDVRALEAKRKALVQGASSEMNQLARTSDYSAIKLALEKYQAFPEEVKVALDKLQERHDDLVEEAKEQLRDLATASDPRQIDQVVARFEAYGETIDEARTGAVSRREKVMEEAKSELSSADSATDAEGGSRPATVAEMQKIYDKYADFPDVQDDRAQLKTKLDSQVSEIHEKLRTALSSHDIAQINEAVALHAGCGDHLETTFARLIKQQRSMMDTMRNKMKNALTSHNTDKIVEILSESEPYGESMARWRLALEERKKTSIKTVVSELVILKESNDSLSVSVALEKFEKFGEKFEDAKPALDELKKHHEGLVDDAKSRLKKLAEGTDINAMRTELPAFESYGTALTAERDEVQTRIKTLLSEAQAKIAAALEGEERIGELDRILLEFETYPPDIQVFRKKLRDKVNTNVRTANQRLKRILKSTDVAAIDAILLEYEDAAEHLASIKEMVRRHRQQLQSSLFFQMKNGMASEDFDEIDKLITMSEGFGDDMAGEREELTQRKTFIVEDVNAKIKTILDKENVGIQEVEACLAKYTKHAAQSKDIEPQFDLLTQKKDALVGEAKQELQRLAEVEDPSEIETGVAKFKEFGDSVDHDREAALTQLAKILDTGSDEIEELLADETKSIVDMAALVDKYSKYGDSFAGSLEKLQAKLDMTVQNASERLERAAQSSNVQEIEQALNLHAESSGEVLATLVSAVQKHRDELIDGMRKQVEEIAASTEPEQLADFLKQLADFGESMEPEHTKVSAQLESVTGDITNELRELVGSDNFATVSTTIAKYESIREDVSASWSMQLIQLQQRRDELIDDAKAALRKLKLEKEPKLLMEGIDQYSEMGHALDVEKEALQDRLHGLVGAAVTEIHDCMKKSQADITAISEVVSKYEGWPQGVSEPLEALVQKKQTAIVTADKVIRTAISSSDILHINDLLAEYQRSETFVPDAYGALVARRLDLEEDMKDKLKNAASPESKDPREIEAVLLECQPYGDGVEEDRLALQNWLASVFDKFVEEVEHLTKSQDYGVVSSAIDKFAGYPPPVEAPWQKLVQHRAEILDSAKAKLAELCYVETPMEITVALPQFAAYGEDVAEARNVALAAYSKLIDAARSEIEMWIDRPDATIEGMSDTILVYSDYPEEVGRLRSRLEKKRNSAVRIAEKRLTAALTSDISPYEVSALMNEYEPARNLLGAHLEKLEGRRVSLVATAAERLHKVSQEESADPRAIQQVVSECEHLGDLVRGDLDMARERYNAITQQAADNLLSMVGTESRDFAHIEEVLQRYEDYPDEVKVHWEKLLQHRNLLVRTARLELQEIAASSTDHTTIMEALQHYEQYGSLLEGERQVLNARLVKLSDESIAEIMRAVHQKTAPLRSLEALLAKYADYPDMVESARAQLKQRIDALRTLKARLQVIKTTCHPHDITSELERYADYGDAIKDEREILTIRFEELIVTARDELQGLVDAKLNVDFTPTEQAAREDGETRPPIDIQTIEAALDRYEHFPQVSDLRSTLQIKFERHIQATIIRLTRLQASEDIVAIDQALAGCQQSGNALAAPLMALQRRRIDLCDRMSDRMRAVMTSANPSDIDKALRESEPYGADLNNERRMLTERLGRSMKQAESEIAKEMHSDNATRIDAVLEKFSRYPSELQRGALADLRMHKEEMRRGMISKVEMAMSSEDLHMIDSLRRDIETHFGDDMQPYIEMLLARRDKMRDVTVVRMHEALKSDNLLLIDRVFANSMPLVEQIDEELWNKLRHHRERVVKGLRGRVRDALSGSNLEKLDALLESVEACKQEMIEEFYELQEHRAYLLEEAHAVAAQTAERFTGRTIDELGYGALEASISHLKSFGEHVGDELGRLQLLQSDMIATAKSKLGQLIELPLEQAEAKNVIAARKKYAPYGVALQHELRALEVLHSRIGERCQQTLQEIIAARVRLQQETELGHQDEEQESVAAELPTPTTIMETLDQAQHYEALASEVQRAREFIMQLITSAKHAMHRVLEAVDPPLVEIQQVVRKYRNYSTETHDIWAQVHARYMSTLSTARIEILNALSIDDLHEVSLVLRRFAAAGSLDGPPSRGMALPAAGQAAIGAAADDDAIAAGADGAANADGADAAELGSVRDVAKDIEALQGHYRQLVKEEQQALLELLRSEDIVVLHQRVGWHTTHEHPLLAREVNALRRRLRKLEVTARARLEGIARGVNVIEMEQSLRRYEPLMQAAGTQTMLTNELTALQKRRESLLERNSGSGASGRNSSADGGTDTDSATLGSSPTRSRSVLTRGVLLKDDLIEGPVSIVGGHDAAVMAAREHLTQMLGSDDIVAMDDVIHRYDYLGGSVSELLHRLKTRRAIVAAVPRGRQYTTLQDNDERLAELELSNRGLRERLRTEEDASGRVEARLQAERDATRRAEEQIESLRRQLLQRTRVEQLQQGRRSPRGPAGAADGAAHSARVREVEERKRCPVCKNLFVHDEWKQHTAGCVDAIVRYSIMKSMGGVGNAGAAADARGAGPGASPRRAAHEI